MKQPDSISQSEKVEVQLEMTSTEFCDPDEIFYRYRVGRYIFWFVQHQDNGKKAKHQNCVGCIFSVHAQSDDRLDFNIRVSTKIGSDLGYPEDFIIDEIPHTIDLDDVHEFTSRLAYAKKCLQTVKEFLYNSIHYQLFKKREKLK